MKAFEKVTAFGSTPKTRKSLAGLNARAVKNRSSVKDNLHQQTPKPFEMMLTGDPALQMVVERPEPEPETVSLRGWSVEERQYGIGTCVGCSGAVLCFGKWGVVGHTGHYAILFPSGWVESLPVFKTEFEAMRFVLSKYQ